MVSLCSNSQEFTFTTDYYTLGNAVGYNTATSSSAVTYVYDVTNRPGMAAQWQQSGAQAAAQNAQQYGGWQQQMMQQGHQITNQITPEQLNAMGQGGMQAQAHLSRQQYEQQQEAFRIAAENRKKADEAAEQLMLAHLTDEQQAQYKRDRYFEVLSKTSRRRYRLTYGWSGNVFVYDDKGRQVERLCIHPSVTVPVPDHLLAQKLMLESDEDGFRRTANITRLAA